MAAGNSVIGALRVDLGLNSAQFTTGLKKAEDGLGKFGKAAAIGLGAVAAAATAAGVALGVAVKGAIDHADALSKAAQKAGTSVEALSRLEYAANLSDVSLEDLTGSLGKLGKAMVEAATNAKSGAAGAFAALGVSVTDASGDLRDTGDVFSDLAARFSGLEDGATKTALAMAVFGKSGAELLPMLNSGADGLKQMAEESDKLGLTISSRAAKASEGFNDSLTRVGLALRGMTTRLMQQATPALEGFAQVISDPALIEAVGNFGQAIINAMSRAVPYIRNAANNLTILNDLFSDFKSKSEAGQANVIADIQNEITTIENRITETRKRLTDGGAGTLWGLNDAALQAQIEADAAKIQPLIDKMNELQQSVNNTTNGSAWTGGWGSGGFDKNKKKTTDTTTDVDLSKLATAAKEATESINPLEARMAELSDVLSQQHSPLLTMKDDLTDLETMWREKAISAEAFGNAVARTYYNVAGAALDMASSVTGTLSKMFKDNKAIAVADAVVQGLSGVAKALGSSPPPLNFINAGLVAAASAANVANILSANESTTSMPGTVTPGATGAAPQSSAINLTVRGSGMISVDDLADQLAQSISDGGNSNLITVMRAAI